MEEPPGATPRKLFPARSEGSLSAALSDTITRFRRLRLQRSNIQTEQQGSRAFPQGDTRVAAATSLETQIADDTTPSRLSSNCVVHGLYRVARTLSRRPRPQNMDPIDLVADESAKEACVRDVAAIFGDICPQYLEGLIDEKGHDAGVLINYIVDQEGSGKPYARKPAASGSLKRKRSCRESVEDRATRAKQIYDNPERRSSFVSSYHAHKIRKLISGDFPFVPVKVVQDLLAQNNRLLLPTYLLVHDVAHGKDQDTLPRTKKLRRSPQEEPFLPENLESTIRHCPDPDQKAILEELQAARRFCEVREQEAQDKMSQEERYEREFREAKTRGLVFECECCFTEFPVGHLVNCAGGFPHRFCMGCMRRQAETLIGLSKYEITCLSMDNCDAPFCFEQRSRFLDDNLRSALDRIEAEAVLRMANLEDLVNCPFCPYAAECPPVEEDKEFRCLNPDCEIVSCRLCKVETHIPKSCEEAAKEKGYSARRNIEEAMSKALIRKCNKCSTPFIKELGCNKMACTRKGCKNVQCYICSESCEYSHFNDASRGGKAGNCPLFDSVNTRHEDEVREAEEAARKQIADERPDLNPDLLKFDMSKEVAQDDQRRKHGDVRNMGHGVGARPDDLAIYEARQRVRIAALQAQYPVGVPAPAADGGRSPAEMPQPVHMHMPMQMHLPGFAGRARDALPESLARHIPAGRADAGVPPHVGHLDQGLGVHGLQPHVPPYVQRQWGDAEVLEHPNLNPWRNPLDFAQDRPKRANDHVDHEDALPVVPPKQPLGEPLGPGLGYDQNQLANRQQIGRPGLAAEQTLQEMEVERMMNHRALWPEQEMPRAPMKPVRRKPVPKPVPKPDVPAQPQKQEQKTQDPQKPSQQQNQPHQRPSKADAPGLELVQSAGLGLPAQGPPAVAMQNWSIKSNNPYYQLMRTEREVVRYDLAYGAGNGPWQAAQAEPQTMQGLPGSGRLPLAPEPKSDSPRNRIYTDGIYRSGNMRFDWEYEMPELPEIPPLPQPKP